MAKIALIIGLGVAGFFTGGLAWAAEGTAFAVGAAMTGLSIGLTAGNILGGLLFPMQLPNQVGPRLNDLTVSTSTNGSAIPIGYGTFRFAGNIIWSPGLQEHSKTTKQGGKGGPSYSSTTYTYTASWATTWGEGPATILKIWFDSKIGYDATSGSNIATYPAPTFYPGNEAQMPDPLIQGMVGVNKTSAFRGLVYAVWEDFLLTDFGNRIPNQQALVQFTEKP
jgi:hypothetical protein